MAQQIHPKDHGLALQRKVGKKSRGPTKAKTAEAVTQDLVEQYIDLIGVYKLHIPEFLLANAFGRRVMSGPELGAAKEAAEEIRGFPDLVVFYLGYFLAIELKTEIGKMSKAQLLWQERLGTLCLRSFEETKAVVDQWKARCDA